MEREKWLTVKEAAEEMRRCAETVRRLVKSGDLAAKRVTSRILIPASAVRDYIHNSPNGVDPSSN